MRILTLLCLVACGASDPTPAPAEAPAEIAPEAPSEAAAAPAEAAGEGTWNAFGEPVADGDIVAIGAFFETPDAFEGKTVRLQGRVTDVCQKAGCWMVMTDDTNHLRITMKDHAFAVDKQGAGSDCIVEGIVKSKAVDPAEVAHFKSESTEGAVIPEEQATSDKTWELVASGVKMRKDG